MTEGGIYNRDKINTNADAMFEHLRVWDGGALFNAHGVQFRFQGQATALFLYSTSHDGIGCALFNDCFSSVVAQLFSSRRMRLQSTIHPTGETVLSENSVFWTNEDSSDPVIFVASGGEIDTTSSV